MAKSRLKIRNRFGSGNGNGKRPTAPPEEDQRSVAVTVAWMLATLATFGAICLSGLAYLLIRLLSEAAGAPNPLAALPGLLQWIAMVTGLFSLAMIPLVYRVRPIPPPRAVTIGAMAIAISPWVILLVRLLT